MNKSKMPKTWKNCSVFILFFISLDNAALISSCWPLTKLNKIATFKLMINFNCTLTSFNDENVVSGKDIWRSISTLLIFSIKHGHSNKRVKSNRYAGNIKSVLPLINTTRHCSQNVQLNARLVKKDNLAICSF